MEIVLTIVIFLVCLGCLFYLYRITDKRISKIFNEFKINFDSLEEEKNLIIGHLGKIDVAIINSVNSTYIFEQLDPEYPKTWTGKVPYQMEDVFIGSEFKFNDYIYKIENIEDETITLTRS